MIKKFLIVLFLFTIILTNKAHEKLELDNCLYIMCGNGGNPVVMKIICND